MCVKEASALLTRAARISRAVVMAYWPVDDGLYASMD
jgi:hypothetical protein